MSKHNWMVEVLVDLEKYAEKNDLKSLTCLLGEARSAAEKEINAIHTNKKNAQDIFLCGRLN